MVETDYIIRELALKQTAVFDVLELYKLLKNSLKERGYTLYEREYENIKKELLTTKIKLEGNKKIDEYATFGIRVKIKIDNYEDFEIKNKKLTKGGIEFSFETVIYTDYEERLENKPIRKFLRAVYDKFIARDKYAKYEQEVKEDTYAIYNELKAYLNLYKLR